MPARFLKKRSEKIGLAPGSLVFVGEKKMEKPKVRLINYNNSNLQEIELQIIRESDKFKKIETVTWLNVDGLHDDDLIRDIGNEFELDSLILEDIMNTGQRPKLEEFDNAIFIVAKMLNYDETKDEIISEQLSLVIGENFLLTFQERVGDYFEPVRNRIRKSKGRIRNAGVDYLAYALLDTVVDNYIMSIEKLGEKIEDIEEEIIDNPDPEILEKIQDFKREVNFMRKGIRPAREFILQLSKIDSDLVDDNTIPFLKDLLDLITQAVESVEVYREMLNDQLNIYHTSVSNKMNEVMKILTIFAAIFIPLTFIAGIYGTNFEYFPELGFKYSYFIFWGILITVGLIMLRYFKNKNWL